MVLRGSDPKSEEQRSARSPAPEAPVLAQQETVVTHGPTQDTTERRSFGSPGDLGSVERPTTYAAASRTVVRDLPREQRRNVALATQVLWFVVGLLETVLALRLALMISGANPTAGFTQLIFGFSRPLVALFLGIFPNMVTGSFEFEPATVVAMVVYFLLGLGLARLVWILYGEPRETE